MVKITEITNSLPTPDIADKYLIVDISADETKFITQGMMNDLFTPKLITATGANTAITMPNIMARRPYFEDFGAIGNGTTNDSPAIAYAISQCLSLGYRSLSGTPGKKYNINQAVTLSALGNANRNSFELIMDGCEFVPAEITGGVTLFDIIRIQGAEPSTYQNLSSNAFKNAFSITTSAPISGAVKGSWIGIRSNKVLNTLIADTQYILLKCVAISGNTYYFDEPLTYDFLTADTARAGLATVRENFRLIAPKCGGEDYDDTTGQYNYVRQFGSFANINHARNILIESPYFQGNKIRGTDSNLLGARSGIKFTHSHDVTVKDFIGKNISWYDVHFGGACKNGRVLGGFGNDCRHTLDITDGDTTGGEPNNIRFENVDSYNTTQSGISTHANGRNISFYKCNSYSSGTAEASYGYIIRGIGHEFDQCKAFYNTLSGFHSVAGAENTITRNCESAFNGGDGFQNLNSSADRINCYSHDNTGAGYYTVCGRVTGGKSERNAYAFRLFYLFGETREQIFEYVYAPFSTGIQTVGLLISSGFTGVTGYTPQEQCLMASNEMIGYGDFLVQVPSGTNTQVPKTDGKNKIYQATRTNPLKGQVTLAGNVTTVNSSTIIGGYSMGAIRNMAVSTTRGKQISKINLSVVSAVNAGVISPGDLINATSFKIYSTSATDNSIVQFEIGW